MLEFIDSGRNVIIAASSEVSDTIRSLIAEVGIDLDDKGTKVFDHFSSASASDHTLVASSEAVQSTAILGKGIKVSQLFNDHFATLDRQILSPPC